MITDISTLTKIFEGRVATVNGSSYLRKLCQHWSHKFPVKYDDTHGKIDLAAGKCIIFADAYGLTVKLMMPEDGDEARLQQVVEEHIKRFSFKEELAFVWTPVAVAGSGHVEKIVTARRVGMRSLSHIEIARRTMPVSGKMS